MGTSLTRTVDPTFEAVTLSEIKDHLRITDDDSDVTLANLIIEGREWVEGVTGRSLTTQTYEMRMDVLDEEIKVPRPPLQSVTSIQYQDTSDATQTLASTEYTVDTKSHPGRINQAYGKTYPDTYDDLNAVTVTFVAGYGNPEDVPESLKRAIKLYVEKMFDMCDAAYGQALDDALDAMLMHYKVDNIAL